MNGAKATSRSTVAVGVQILLWVWLVVLSILVGTGHRTMAGLADRAHVDSSQRQVQVLQARIAELADSVHMLETQPELARSDEHTSELKSLMRNSYAGFCLKTTNKKSRNNIDIDRIQITT